MRILLILTILAIFALSAIPSHAEDVQTVTVKTYDDVRSLPVSKTDPPLPDWLRRRADADPAIVGAVALSDGRWIIEVQRPIIAEDDLNDLWVSGFDAQTEPQALLELFSQVGDVRDVEIRHSVGVEHGTPYDNRSAVVKMKSADAALKAEQLWMGKQWNGSELYVKAKTADWLSNQYIHWDLYDAAGNHLPDPHHAHGTGWEDHVWAGGWFDTLGDSGLVHNRYPQDNNTMAVGGYFFVFDDSKPEKPVQLVYKDSTGQLVYDFRAGGDCMLQLFPYRYCREIRLRKIEQRMEATHP